MAEPTKDELVHEAEQAGVENAQNMTKAELERALEGRAPEALGPVVPAGEVTAPAQKRSGAQATKGVQPMKASDIPEAGR